MHKLPLSLEILILVLMSVLLVFQVNNTTGAAGSLSMKDIQIKPGKEKDQKYVQFIANKPILMSSPSSNVQFDGDVYFSADEMTWDWNDSHQQPSRRPALYLADPFINIQHDPGQFQGMRY